MLITFLRTTLAFLSREPDDLGVVSLPAWRLLPAESFTERQGWGAAGPVQVSPTAAQRARKRM